MRGNQGTAERIRKGPGSERRSPITRNPLRVAGQSLDEGIHAYLEEKAYPLGAFAVFMTAIALMEWWRWLRDLPPYPGIMTVAAVGAWAWFLYRLPQHRRRLHAMRLGREGERAVAEFLDRFRESGYHVFHDVPGQRGNIDHVLVGPAGVFTIETKTVSKPATGDALVVYDGETVTVGGWKPDRDPIAQAKAQAQSLGECLEELVGQTRPVQPVVFYPGWFVVPPPTRPRVWVLNPKALPAFLERQGQRLSEEQVRVVAALLKRSFRQPGV